ncbi:outer membrane beta-barrel protein [uncultured Psychroserpens sp.]|uniref:outer membrane beta-barrel protein n=1 Tax=uncultured Psychroserpens sp. TaxID=255436 RepID=UPI00260AFF76|nr:outer membrane beta-barrel protein [uncultured Psychroserpens sp.]
MKSTITLFLFLFSFTLFAQIKYEKGYVIDNTGKKIDCYIRNLDWSNNPLEVQYRLEENSETITADITSVSSFMIGNSIKYVKATVQVDQSSSKASKLSNRPEPNFKSETVFIRELVSGDAKLYAYKSNKFKRFFYQLDGGKIEPLIYKKYYVSNNSVATNESYRKTLFDTMKCRGIDSNTLREIDYNQDDLVGFFSDYNICISGENLVLQEEPLKGKFNIRVKAGLSVNQLNVEFDEGAIRQDRQSAQFPQEIGPRFGLELESLLPFNKNKWGVFLEPTFMSYSSSVDIRVENDVTVFEDTATIDYKVIEIPFGLRHYMYLSDKSKIFINAALVLTVDLTDEIDYADDSVATDNDPDIKSSSNLLFGLGYEFNDRFSIEARTYTNRDILSSFVTYNGEFSSYGVVLGYRFL